MAEITKVIVATAPESHYVLDGILGSQTRHCSPNTLASYAHDLRHLRRFFDRDGLTWAEFAPHMKLGFALQLVTVRWLGTFLEDPGAVLDFVAGQLGVADPSQVKRYTEGTKTRFDHQWEIHRACGLREFTDVETEFAGWVAARSWTSAPSQAAASPLVPPARRTPGHPGRNRTRGFRCRGVRRHRAPAAWQPSPPHQPGPGLNATG